MRENVASLLEAVTDALVAVDPGWTALVHGERSLTWQEVDDRAARPAPPPARAGVSAGDRVGIALYNSPEYLETFHAALKLRAVPVNVNYRYREAELEQVLGYAGIVALVADASLIGVVTAARLPTLRTVVVVGAETAAAGL